jgi:hypothetical protein
MTARTQLAEQYELTVEDIARAFHYPLFAGRPAAAVRGQRRG